MIQAGNYPITVRRGDTGTWQFKLEDLDDDGVVIGPVDITSWTLRGSVKYDQNTVWFNLPIVKVDPKNGVFQFYVDKAVSDQLVPVGSTDPDSSSYEIQFSYDNAGREEVGTILVGTFTVVRDLVRKSDDNLTPVTPNQ